MKWHRLVDSIATPGILSRMTHQSVSLISSTIVQTGDFIQGKPNADRDAD
jgi:hypothetical protein